MLKLDVGCGSLALGDVNVDLHYGKANEIQPYTNPKKIKNFVMGHACYLPFQNKKFDITTCFHVIEHLEKPEEPSLLLKELIRVTKNKIVVKCPHRFSSSAKQKFHKQYFNATWFHKTLKNIRHTIAVVYAWNRFLFTVPDEITVTIYP